MFGQMITWLTVREVVWINDYLVDFLKDWLDKWFEKLIDYLVDFSKDWLDKLLIGWLLELLIR